MTTTTTVVTAQMLEDLLRRDQHMLVVTLDPDAPTGVTVTISAASSPLTPSQVPLTEDLDDSGQPTGRRDVVTGEYLRAWGATVPAEAIRPTPRSANPGWLGGLARRYSRAAVVIAARLYRGDEELEQELAQDPRAWAKYTI